MAFLPDYAELHCLSNFSFLRGASHPQELVERAHALGYRALALTDECSLAGAVRAHQAAKECGLQLILGTEVMVEKTKLVLLATDRRSYGAVSSPDHHRPAPRQERSIFARPARRRKHWPAAARWCSGSRGRIRGRRRGSRALSRRRLDRRRAALRSERSRQ